MKKEYGHGYNIYSKKDLDKAYDTGFLDALDILEEKFELYSSAHQYLLNGIRELLNGSGAVTGATKRNLIYMLI